MNKTAALIASAVLCLFALPAHSQVQGDQFGPSADADIVWHPVSKYIEKACKQIRANWNPPCAEDADSAVVTFAIDMEGRPIDVRLKESSQVPELDNLALNSVKSCAGFGPIPKERKEQIQVDLRYSTHLPDFYYGPDYSRCVKVVLLADKDESVSALLTQYPVDLEAKLAALWSFDSKVTKDGEEFCVVRVKVARDGTVEQCRLMEMHKAIGCSELPGNSQLEAAALTLIRENKVLLPRAFDNRSRYLFLSFRPRRGPYEKSSLIAYKGESPAVKRFSDSAGKLVLSHWQPALGENLTGAVRLEVTLDANGFVKKMETRERSGGRIDFVAAKRALNESLPLVPPDGASHKLFLDFEADEDPSTWKLFHRYFEFDMEGYTAEMDTKKTDENLARRSEKITSK